MPAGEITASPERDFPCQDLSFAYVVCYSLMTRSALVAACILRETINLCSA